MAQSSQAAKPDTISREGLIFFHLSSEIPVEGIFVGMRLDTGRSVQDQMDQLSEGIDTGVLIPVFELHRSGIAYESFIRKAMPFINEGSSDRMSVLPVRLLFVYAVRFDGRVFDGMISPTAIAFKKKKLLAVSRAKPPDWGVLVGMQPIQTR